MRLTVLCVLCAVIWTMNCNSLQTEEFSTSADEKVEMRKIKRDREACWFGRCTRRRRSKRNLKQNEIQVTASLI